MIVRPIDANGDMMPVWNDSQMLSGADAVAQVVKERLCFYQGEWWEDDELGIGLPDFIADNVRKSDIDLLAKYITSYIAETRGVAEISGITAKYNKGVLSLRCLIIADDGQSEVEVDLSGLL